MVTAELREGGKEGGRTALAYSLSQSVDAKEFTAHFANNGQDK
jgi:hypothetical protein